MIRLIIVLSVVAWFMLLQRVIWRNLFDDDCVFGRSEYDKHKNKPRHFDKMLSWVICLPLTVLVASCGALIVLTIQWVYAGF